MFSGGVCSWAASKRMVAKHGKADSVLLFADTMMEDEDLYRFLNEAAANVGIPLVRIADGRTPWQVMEDNKIIANTGMDVCSRVLKRELMSRWRDEHGTPEETTVYLGLDAMEQDRTARIKARYLPWRYEAPMTEPPYMSKLDMLQWLGREGIKAPRLYGMGFPHNNCGGFCIKAGQAHFAHLLRTMPERYAFHEMQEEHMRTIVGDHSILKDRRGGATKPLTLKAFRERIEAQGDFDEFEWGGCGCAME